MELKIKTPAHFLIEFMRGGLITLTSIIPDGSTTTRTFSEEEEPEIAKWVDTENKAGKNIYFHPNPPRSPKRSKLKDEDVHLVHTLHVDMDAQIYGADLDEEQDRILRVLKEGPLHPTVVLCTGNGMQAFWFLKNAVPVNGNSKELTAQNARIAKYFEADNCQSISHLMRVPFTINYPNKNKRKKGRVVTKSKLLYFGGESYV